MKMCPLAPLSPKEKGSTEGFSLTEEALCVRCLRCELLFHRSSVECTLLTGKGASPTRVWCYPKSEPSRDYRAPLQVVAAKSLREA
jgi:hypothetical protein